MTLLARLLVIASLSPSLWAQAGPSPILQPATYTSPSGDYSLYVNPSDRHGVGGSLAELRFGDKLAWSKQLEFTFWSAAVSDSGVAMGYGYSQGIQSSRGDFLVQSFSPSGEPLLKRTSARFNSNEMHSSPYPRGDGPLVNQIGDYFIVHVATHQNNERVNLNWVSRISDGTSLGDYNPMDSFDDETVRFDVTNESIPGTPLFVTQWYCYEWKGAGLGARFQVSDLEGKVIWSLACPGDYEDEQGKLDFDLGAQIRSGRHFIETGPHATFRVDQCMKAISTTFEVVQDPKGEWEVHESGDAPFKVTKRTSKSAAPGMDSVPQVELKEPGTIDFKTQGLGVSPVKDVWQFDVDGQGRMGVLRRNEGDFRTFELLDSEGEPQTAVDLKELKRASWTRYNMCWLQEDRWLILTAWDEDESPMASAHWVDSKTAELTRIGDWKGLGADVVRRMPDGGFVMLGTARYGGWRDSGLICFDPQGGPLWRVGQSYENPEDIFGAEDICVTPSGEIIVLENVSNRLKIYDRLGTHLQTIELAGSLGAEPSYLTQILALPEGGYILQDADLPRFLMLDQNFKLTERFEPRFPDRVTKGVRDLVLGGAGKLWAKDIGAFLQMDRELLVGGIIGTLPMDNALDKQEHAFVDSSGQVYLVDARTGNIHVFDSTGSPLFICTPDDSDYAEHIEIQDLRVSSTGEITLTTDLDIFKGRDIRFNNQGERLAHTLNPDTYSNRVAFQPGSTRTWLLKEETLKLQDVTGKTISQQLRAPTNAFFTDPGPMAVAPNGTIAIFDPDSISFGDMATQAGANVHLFDPDGSPLRTLRIPAGCYSYPDIAFNGQYIALTQGKDKGVLLINAQTNALLQTQPIQASSIFFSPSGLELWTFPYMSTIMTRLLLP